jgi:hypothetical protein
MTHGPKLSFSRSPRLAVEARRRMPLGRICRRLTGRIASRVPELHNPRAYLKSQTYDQTGTACRSMENGTAFAGRIMLGRRIQTAEDAAGKRPGRADTNSGQPRHCCDGQVGTQRGASQAGGRGSRAASGLLTRTVRRRLHMTTPRRRRGHSVMTLRLRGTKTLPPRRVRRRTLTAARPPNSGSRIEGRSRCAGRRAPFAPPIATG